MHNGWSDTLAGPVTWSIVGLTMLPFAAGSFWLFLLSVVTAWAEFTAGAALLYTGVRHIAAS